MIRGPGPRWLSVAALALALVVVVCGVAPAPAAGARERGCQTGKVVESVSGKAQTVEAPAGFPCHGQEALRPTAIDLLPRPADARVSVSVLRAEISSRAPPVSR